MIGYDCSKILPQNSEITKNKLLLDFQSSVSYLVGVQAPAILGLPFAKMVLPHGRQKLKAKVVKLVPRPIASFKSHDRPETLTYCWESSPSQWWKITGSSMAKIQFAKNVNFILIVFFFFKIYLAWLIKNSVSPFCLRHSATKIWNIKICFCFFFYILNFIEINFRLKNSIMKIFKMK